MSSAKDNSRQFVLTCVRLPLTHSSGFAPALAVPNVIDWEYVVALCEMWEFDALIGSRLRAYFADVVPATVMERLARRESESRASAVVLALEQARLSAMLESSGIDVMALKGPVLSVLGYDDVSMRPSADIDFFLRQSDLSEACRILTEAGFKPIYAVGSERELVRRGHALELVNNKIKVELHSELLSRHLALSIDTDENLWRESRRVDCGGRFVRTLGSQHTLLFACAHGAKHEWSRMKWILDVAQLWDRLSPDSRREAVAHAATSHATGILQLGVGLAGTVFGGDTLPLNEALRSLVNRTTGRLGITGDYREQVDQKDASDTSITTILFWIRARERIRDRARTLIRLGLKPTGVGKSSRASTVIRPARLAWSLVRYAVKRAEPAGRDV